MAKLPKEITISDQSAKIRLRSETWGRKHKAYGMYKDGIIDILKDTTNQKQVDSLIHEIQHFIIEHTTSNTFKLNAQTEEAVITRLASGEAEIYFKYPEILEWMLKKIYETKRKQKRNTSKKL